MRAVGQLDQFAKETFAEETAIVTHGAAAWELPPELNMSEVRLDGLLRVSDAAALAALPAPWSTLREAAEIVLEIKTSVTECTRGDVGLGPRHGDVADSSFPWTPVRRRSLAPVR